MAQCVPHFETLVRPAPQQATQNTVTTPSETTVVTSWNRLPGDIRHYILDFLSHQHRRKHIYATVCREWRIFMEERNFRNLTICHHGLTGLEHLSPRSRTTIRHLWFNIHLTGTCHECLAAIIQQRPTINGAAVPLVLVRPIEYYLYQLFRVLSSWEFIERGLALEFNAYWLMGQAHWLKNWFIGCPGESHRIPVLTFDPRHDWRTLTAASGVRIIEDSFRPISLANNMTLPLADAVTKFVIRRHCRNRFRPSDIAKLVNACPRLVHLHLETWAHINAHDISANGHREYDLIANIHPTSLQKLTIFQDLCREYIFIPPLVYGHRRVYVDQQRWRNENSKQFAARSLNLQQLSISFMVQAETFFSDCQPDWTWQNLQSIILTTRLFTRNLDSKEVSVFLQDAAQVALRMPSLKTMVLWDGRRGHASSFTYCRTDMAATITWCSTVDLDFDRYTVQAWEQVARQHGHPYLWSQKRQIGREEVISHGHAIRLLKLPPQVIDPESREQIEKEYEVADIPGVHRTPLRSHRLN